MIRRFVCVVMFVAAACFAGGAKACASEMMGDMTSDSIMSRRARMMERHEEVKAKVDSAVTAKYYFINYDTAYIARPKEAWMIRVRGNVSGSELNVSRKNGPRAEGHLRSGYKATLSVGASYRGIAAGLAVNPMKFIGKGHHFEMNVNAYANKYGVDVVYLDSKTLSGNTYWGADKIPVGEGDMTISMLNVNGYYAFNGDRFSFPAAFSQSYIQKRSAGSILAGFSYMGGSVKTTESRPQPLPDLRVYLGYFGIGMGYGYNMVIRRRWLLHASALPTFVVLNRSNIRVSGTRSDLSTGLPNVILTERMALIYNVKSDKFFGGTFVVTHSFLGDDHMVLNYSKWRARIFWGMRF